MKIRPKRFLFGNDRVWGFDTEEAIGGFKHMHRMSGVTNQIIRNRTVNVFLNTTFDFRTCDSYKVKKEQLNVGSLGNPGIGLSMSPFQNPGSVGAMHAQGLYNHLSAAQAQSPNALLEAIAKQQSSKVYMSIEEDLVVKPKKGFFEHIKDIFK